MRYYKLVGRTPVLATPKEAAAFIDDPARIINKTKVGNIRISTVFLCLNHAFSDEEAPLLFETMIFGGKHDQYQERYATYGEAEVGHDIAVNMVMNELPKGMQYEMDLRP